MLDSSWDNITTKAIGGEIIIVASFCVFSHTKTTEDHDAIVTRQRPYRYEML